jgi:hypothetical protein
MSLPHFILRQHNYQPKTPALVETFNKTDRSNRPTQAKRARLTTPMFDVRGLVC